MPARCLPGLPAGQVADHFEAAALAGSKDDGAGLQDVSRKGNVAVQLLGIQSRREALARSGDGAIDAHQPVAVRCVRVFVVARRSCQQPLERVCDPCRRVADEGEVPLRSTRSDEPR